MVRTVASLFALALASVSLGAAAAPQKAVETRISGKGYTFHYDYPEVVKRFPDLHQQIEKDKATQLSELRALAAEWVRDAPERARETDLETQTRWAVVTDLPGWLSLTQDSYGYSGGAHGNWGRSSLVWDKRAGRSRQPIDLFSSPAAFDRAVQTRYCDLLDKERSQKRDGATIDRSQKDDWMQACPKPSELTLIFGSSNGKAFNRLAVYAGPYAVGPYVEGDYEISLPVTPQMLAAVKPVYRASFALNPGQGKARK